MTGKAMTNREFITLFRDHLRNQEENMRITSEAVQGIREVLVKLSKDVEENNEASMAFKNKLIMGLIILLGIIAFGKEVVALAFGGL